MLLVRMGGTLAERKSSWKLVLLCWTVVRLRCLSCTISLSVRLCRKRIFVIQEIGLPEKRVDQVGAMLPASGSYSAFWTFSIVQYNNTVERRYILGQHRICLHGKYEWWGVRKRLTFGNPPVYALTSVATIRRQDELYSVWSVLRWLCIGKAVMQLQGYLKNLSGISDGEYEKTGNAGFQTTRSLFDI